MQTSIFKWDKGGTMERQTQKNKQTNNNKYIYIYIYTQNVF